MPISFITAISSRLLFIDKKLSLNDTAVHAFITKTKNRKETIYVH